METLGQAGQIVKVAPGYARNRLIPNMLALPAIEKFVLLVHSQIQVLHSAYSFHLLIPVGLVYATANRQTYMPDNELRRRSSRV